ncbi:hypothetical protein Tco_0494854 [Tanacetum coccineum]
MTTLAEHMIVASAKNRPPMLDKTMYNSWQSHMLLYMKGKKNSRTMLESIEKGPLVYPTIKEDGKTHEKKYAELTKKEKLQDDCDVQATNIVHVNSAFPQKKTPEQLEAQAEYITSRLATARAAIEAQAAAIVFDKFGSSRIQIKDKRKLRKLEEVYERKIVELKEDNEKKLQLMRKEFVNERANLVEDAVRKILEKLPPEVARMVLT